MIHTTTRHTLFFIVSLIVTAVIWRTAPAVAARPSVSVDVSDNDVYLGDDITYQVKVSNIKPDSEPAVPSVPNRFKVRYVRMQPSRQVMISIINGNRKEEVLTDYVYLYQITPLRAGTITIPPPKLTVSGKTTSVGRPVSIRVRDADRTDKALIIVSIKPKTVRQYQMFTATITFYFKPIPGGGDTDPMTVYDSIIRNPFSSLEPPKVTIPWLDSNNIFVSVEDEMQWLQAYGYGSRSSKMSLNIPRSMQKSLQYSRFRFTPKKIGRRTRKDSKGRSVNYFVYAIKRKMMIRRPGTYTLSPVTMRGPLFARVQTDRFGRQQFVPVMMYLKSNSPTVTVLPTPELNEFDGVYGNYTISAKASPTRLKETDPMTLEVTIRQVGGVGELDRISGVTLSDNTRKMFRMIEAEPGVSQNDRAGTKTYTFTMRPLSGSITQIDPVSFTYLNIAKGKIETISTHPIPLTVLPAEQTPLNIPGGSADADTGPKRTDTGVVHFDPPGIVHVPTSLSPIPAALFSLMLLGLYMLALLSVVIWTKIARNESWMRRAKAKAKALSIINDPNAGPDQYRVALLGLFSDMCDLPPAGTTTHNAVRILTAATSDADLINETRQLFDAIDMAGYGAGEANIDKARVKTLIEKIAPALRRRATRPKTS